MATSYLGVVGGSTTGVSDLDIISVKMLLVITTSVQRFRLARATASPLSAPIAAEKFNSRSSALDQYAKGLETTANYTENTNALILLAGSWGRMANWRPPFYSCQIRAASIPAGSDAVIANGSILTTQSFSSVIIFESGESMTLKRLGRRPRRRGFWSYSNYSSLFITDNTTQLSSAQWPERWISTYQQSRNIRQQSILSALNMGSGPQLVPMPLALSLVTGNAVANKAFHKWSLAGSITLALVLRRRVGLVRALSITLTPIISRRAKFLRNLSLTETNTPAITVGRRFSRSQALTVPLALSLSRLAKFRRAVALAVGLPLTLQRRVGKKLTITTAQAISVRRTSMVKLSRSFTVTFVLKRVRGMKLSLALLNTPLVMRRLLGRRTFSVSITDSLLLQRRTGLRRSLILPLVPTLTKRFSKKPSLAISLFSSIIVRRHFMQALSMSFTSVLSVTRRMLRKMNFSVSTSSTSALSYRVSRKMTRGISLVNSMQKRAGRRFQISTILAPSVVKRSFLRRSIVLTVNFTTAVLRQAKMKRNFTLSEALVVNVLKIAGLKQISLPRTVSLAMAVKRQTGRRFLLSMGTGLTLRRSIRRFLSAPVAAQTMLKRRVSKSLHSSVLGLTLVHRRPTVKFSRSITLVLSLARRKKSLVPMTAFLTVASTVKSRVGRTLVLNQISTSSIRRGIRLVEKLATLPTLRVARLMPRRIGVLVTLMGAISVRIRKLVFLLLALPQSLNLKFAGKRFVSLALSVPFLAGIGSVIHRFRNMITGVGGEAARLVATRLRKTRVVGGSSPTEILDMSQEESHITSIGYQAPRIKGVKRG